MLASSPMDTRQLRKILNEYMPDLFHGVCAEDELPDLPILPCAIIVNTDPSTEEGTHWTSIYLSTNGTGEFFDSSGTIPDVPVREYMNIYAPRGWRYNTMQLQGQFSTLCGAYCIQYLEARYKSKESYSTLLYRLFPFKNNDELVRERMREQYQIEIPIYDYSFLFSRLRKT